MNHFTCSIFMLSCVSSHLFAQNNIQQLATISILAEQQDVSAAATTTSTKFSHEQLDLPFNRSYLSEEILKQQDVRRIEQALNQVSGVFHQNNYGGGFWDNYSFRGFQGNPNIGADYIRNGLSVSRGISAPKDLLNVESLEFLKGPSAALYGRGEVGGALNITTKKPLWNKKNEVTIRGSTLDEYRLSFDQTAPINDQVAYRLGLAFEDNNSFRDHVSNQRQFINPQLSWKLSEDTQLDFDAEFNQILGTFDRGLTAVNNQLVMDLDTFTGEPSDGDMRVKDNLYQIRLTQRLNPDWKINSAISFKDAHMIGFSTEPRRMQADGRTLERQRRFRDYQTEDILMQTEVLGTVQQNWAKHEIVVGAEIGRLDFMQKQYRRNHSAAFPNSIDIYQPEYGKVPSYDLPLHTLSDERQQYAALNLQDQLIFNDQWNLLLGGRFERVEQEFSNHLTQKTNDETHQQFSPRVAINYRPTQDLSFYANYGEAFAMNNGMGRTFETFKPEQAKSYEVGTKYQWNDEQNVSVAVFDMSKRNVLMKDPIDANYETAAGEVSSRGLELDLSYRINKQIKINANYSYVDAEVSKDDVMPVGSPLTNIPQHAANITAYYDFLDTGAQKAGLNLNVSYVDSRSGDSPTSTANGFSLPSYYLINLGTYYQANPQLRYQLSIHNLLDEKYYLSSYSNTWIQAGEPIKASLSAQWSF